MAELKTEPVETYYDVKEELGRGRFAVVKKCMDKKNNKLYAAKFVRKARQGRSCREQLLLEIDILHTSSHPKMVRLFDVFETRKEMIIIIEYAPGGDLHRHCLEQVETVRTEKEICYLIHQIVEAVQYLHNNKVVHLDLKPENILLSSEERFPEIRLIDFGLSRRLDVPYSQFDIVGTPEYVAPEVLAFEPLEYASDMWSIGVVAYVLLSGISPFAGDEVMETYQNVAQVDFDFDAEEFDEISEDAKDFIEKLLIRKPKDRMTARESLEHPWLKQMADGYRDEDVAAALVAEKIIYESDSEEEEEEEVDNVLQDEEDNILEDEEDSDRADNSTSGLQSDDGLSECGSLLKSEGTVSSDELDVVSNDDINDEDEQQQQHHNDNATKNMEELETIEQTSLKHDKFILKPLDINDNNKILKASGDSSSECLTPSTPPFSDGTPDSRTPDSDFADKHLSTNSLTESTQKDEVTLSVDDDHNKEIESVDAQKKTQPPVLQKKKHQPADSPSTENIELSTTTEDVSIAAKKKDLPLTTECKSSKDSTSEPAEPDLNRRSSHDAIIPRRSSKELSSDSSERHTAHTDTTYKRRSSKETLSADTPLSERHSSSRRPSKETVQSLQSTFERRASGDMTTAKVDRRSSKESVQGSTKTTAKEHISSSRKQSSDSNSGSSPLLESKGCDGRRKNSDIKIEKVLSRTNSEEVSISYEDISTPPVVPGNIDIGKCVSEEEDTPTVTTQSNRKTPSTEADSPPTESRTQRSATTGTTRSSSIESSRRNINLPLKTSKSQDGSSRSSTKTSQFSSKFWGSDATTPTAQTSPGERHAGATSGNRTPTTATPPASKTVVRQGITAMMASKFGSKENDTKTSSPASSPRQPSPTTTRVPSAKSSASSSPRGSIDNGTNIIQSKIQEITMKFGQSPGAESSSKKHVTLSNKTRESSSGSNNPKTYTISSIRSASSKDGKAAASPFAISLKPTGKLSTGDKQRKTPTTKVSSPDDEKVTSQTKSRRSVTSIDAPVNGDHENEQRDKFPDKTHSTAVSRSKSLRRKTSQGSPSSPRKTYRKLYVTHVRGSKSIDIENEAPSDLAEIKHDVADGGLKVKLLVKCKDLKIGTL